MGLKEQIIFPEIDYDKVEAVRGMDIVFVTTVTSAPRSAQIRKRACVRPEYWFCRIGCTEARSRTGNGRPADRFFSIACSRGRCACRLPGSCPRIPGGITPVARDIVGRVPRTQAWIVDRREQAFEDTSVFAGGDPAAAQDYYLGFKYRRVPGTEAKYVAEWGLRQQLEDLRHVVRRARRGGREVILGGHSAAPPRPSRTRPGTSPADRATATSPGWC